jgi:NADH:ubiquinone oxidoreductase subunit F (NADH-binding)
VNFLNTGVARPTNKPPRPFERGVRGRPTLISNVETFAHLALIARFGPDWFRAEGTADSPGTALMTLGGAVRRPGVYELALGATVEQAIATAGGTGAAAQAVLIGGYAGGWLPLPSAGAVHLEHAALRVAGASLGVASLTVLPASACGVVETARIAAYRAGESARQCGPCMFGLPAVADDLRILAAGVGRDRALRDRLRRRMTLLTGRGACGHPDGFTRLLDSALRTFGGDVRDHLHDRPCRGSLSRPVIPVPRVGQPGTGGWR